MKKIDKLRMQRLTNHNSICCMLKSVYAKACMHRRTFTKYQVRWGCCDHLVIIDNGRWPDNGSRKHVNALRTLTHTSNYNRTATYITSSLTKNYRNQSRDPRPLSSFLFFCHCHSRSSRSFSQIRITFNQLMQSTWVFHTRNWKCVYVIA